MANNRNYSESYLFEQVKAMRWLKEQGLTCEQIRDMSWGRIDETDRSIHFPTSVTSLKMDLKTRAIVKNVEIKERVIPIKGSGCEWFFLKSKYKCLWVFTREIPKSWRKEKSREACYSLSNVENFTKGISTPVIPPFIEGLNDLTKALEFGSIRVSIANITNPEIKEQVREEARA